MFKRFENKKEKASHYHIYATGRRFYFLKTKKETNCELVINVKTDNGLIDFFIKDKENCYLRVLHYPKDGYYRFSLPLGKTYTISVELKSHSGFYVFYL